jgi:molybdate transport system permease protein
VTTADPAVAAPGSARGADVAALGLLGAPIVVLLGLPVAVLLVRSAAGGILPGALADSAVLDALALSLLTTALSLVLVIGLGTPLALLLARRRPRGATLLETIVDLPIVLPPSVAGLALLLVFGRRGVIGEPLEVIGVSVPFTTVAVILAQTFVAAPFYIRSARAGLASIDRDLEDAARADGASEPQVLRWVSLPLAAPALTAGIVMCWARALGEFGATIMFAGNVTGRTQTLPLVVYGELQAGHLDAAIAAAAILVLAAVGVLLSVRVLRWRPALDIRGGASRW